jgi:glycyl-tRNA synthetase beta chain
LATFLLEIGTEELPADFARQAPEQLAGLIAADLGTLRLTPSLVRPFGTPRRLAVLAEGLPARQPALEEEHKGPPAAAAYAEGVPTRAAEGFARRCGVAVADLEVRQTARGPFVFARSRQEGRSTPELLAEAVPGWISALQGRRFMRWGDGEQRFSRPVRWLVALLDGEVIPLTLPGCDPVIESARLSRGHRLHDGPVAISEAGAYEACLEAAGVVVDRGLRSAMIQEGLAEACGAERLQPDLPGELFDELVDLVESPLLLEGRIPDRYLGLPAEVLATVMRTHQRYVPLYLSAEQRDPLALSAEALLSPRFLFVASGRRAAAETIRRGNERVLTARLADAAFFLASDRGTASIDRRDALARVTFAEGLGSLLQRSERLEWITDVLLEMLPLPVAAGADARRAAHLCKHDLVSQMVAEFPELQGVIGAKYLLAEGEGRGVAMAVLEHYLPRGAGDALPSSDAGAVLALAERLELLLSIYARGERPSGSSDPYALRRAGNGVMQILWDRRWRLDLNQLLDRAARHWQELLPELPVRGSSLAAAIGEDLTARIASLLEEQGADGDIVQAVAGEGLARERLLADPGDAGIRAQLLADLRHQGQLAPLQAVVQRATNLAARGDLPAEALSPDGVVDPSLFESRSEAAMLATLQTLEPLARASDASGYGRLASGLSNSAGTLAEFFDGASSVMVMCDDPAVRRNRLNLLGILSNQAARLADFSRLSG